MAQQRTQPTRRFASSRSNPKKEERDPHLFLLIVQMVISALLILISYGIVVLRPAYLGDLKTQYQKMIQTREIELPIGEALSVYARRYEELRNDATDAMADFITGLLTPKQAKLDEDTALAEEKQAGEEELNGAGGWMGVGDSDGRSAPASCDLSPIILSAWLEPPTSGKVTSRFGYRAHPVTESDDFHRGVDIAAAAGSRIYTPLPGRVSEVGSSAIYGNYITLDHGNNLLTTYCHCDRIIAQEGENLRKGELLATVGSTGISTGPHVHFEINKNGKYYNPAWVLEGMNNDGI